MSREQKWWLENRTHKEIFVREMEQAFRVLEAMPAAGTQYPAAGMRGLRRIYLPRIACHLYYTFDEHEVIVRAMWGARRLRGPAIPVSDPMER